MRLRARIWHGCERSIGQYPCVNYNRKRKKNKAPCGAFGKSVCYDTLAAIAGVPQLAVRYVVLGGITFTSVVGAVAAPMAVAGLDTAVPPVMFAVVPAAEVPSSTQVVTKVNTVLPALSATVVRINSGV